MPRIDNPSDPYASPHAPKMRGGALVRVVILALLLAGAGAGWAYYSSQPSQGLTPQEEAAVEQRVRVADAGGATSPDTATDAIADAPAAQAGQQPNSAQIIAPLPAVPEQTPSTTQ
jgi:hypothetical protein